MEEEFGDFEVAESKLFCVRSLLLYIWADFQPQREEGEILPYCHLIRSRAESSLGQPLKEVIPSPC